MQLNRDLGRGFFVPVVPAKITPPWCWLADQACRSWTEVEQLHVLRLNPEKVVKQ